MSNGAVVLEHFDQVVGDCFMDCVNCLIGFANNKTSHRISLKAIALLRICEDRLAEVHHIIYIFGHESPFFSSPLWPYRQYFIAYIFSCTRALYREVL